ncbi:MAG TPA: hypothetical protein VN699_11910, partial [Pirellulales bacterium]|nr:hypothetical protein [Pirellulales bacterium]
MDVKIVTDAGSRWGSLTLTMPPEISARVRLQPGQPFQVQGPRYIWRPAPELAADLPSGFQLAVDCLFTQPNGRFFVPAAGFDEASEFAVQAALA